MDGTDLDRAVLGGRDARRPVDGLVDGLAVEDEVAAERLLHLRVRAVGDERLAVADADGRGVARRRELVAAGHDARLARLVRERAVAARTRPRARSSRERLPARLVSVDQCQVTARAPPFRLRFHHDDDRGPEIDNPMRAQLRPSAAASIRSSSVRAPALSSSSFRLPHFGLWTQDGQPLGTGSAGAGAPCPRPSPRSSSKPRSVMPDAAGVAVVDEDRRAAGLEVDVRREAADVPAVAHRPERQQRDQRVLGGMERRRAASASARARRAARAGREPDRLGLEGRLRHQQRHDVDRRAVRDRLPLVRRPPAR